MSDPSGDGVLEPAGTGTRVVQPGECVASIAADEGYAWETLWNHPDNAALKEARGNPYTLLPGDRLTLPPKDRGGRSCVTGKLHRFRRRGIPEKLRVELLDDDGPRGGLEFTVTVDDLVTKGTTGDDGVVEAWIPPRAKQGTLVLRRKDAQPWEPEEEIYPLDLGHLDPPGSESGARARLLNLEYLDTQDDPRYRDVLCAFQRIHGLEANGLLDDATQAKLLELNGY